MTKLQDTQRTIGELKELCELLYSAPESDLLELYPKFELFKTKLNALLSTVTRYRIQLHSSDSVYGPKTLKTVEEVVSDYDKLYEIYQENLHDVFSPLTHVHREQNSPDNEEELVKKINEETMKRIDEETMKRIDEETKLQLDQIEYKRKLKHDTNQQINFETIRDEETPLKDVLNAVLRVYREDACDNLEQVLCDIYSAHTGEFVKIVENITNLMKEISKRPDELSLRVLRINNQKLRDDFLTHYNSAKLLKFTGFKVTTTQDLQHTLKSLGMSFGDEYFLYLHEPDMFTLYDKWRAWLDNINHVSDTLERFLTKFKKLQKSTNHPNIISQSLTF
ncbi:PUB domain protein [Theileria parva strain Muguga]|uniref:PUB domain protein n=1 Tax=Theileria parva strain Muguga TaxID=333668 RepID=UPI001C61A4C4|nr:PUB domain protein [Theileria parva strain Muguga]KAF5153073.1 PUB domain protein [Theileria parva strain Muguga]